MLAMTALGWLEIAGMICLLVLAFFKGMRYSARLRWKRAGRKGFDEDMRRHAVAVDLKQNRR